MENMEKKSIDHIIKEENDRKKTMNLDESSQLAAIYVSDEAKKEVAISRQVEECQKFLSDRGMLFSGDLFIAKEGAECINELIRARATSGRFQYMISYLLYPSKSKEIFLGVIIAWNVKNFLGTIHSKIALKE